MSGPLTFIVGTSNAGHRGLINGAVEANKASARQWRLDNPDFFATDPATRPDPAAHNRSAPA